MSAISAEKRGREDWRKLAWEKYDWWSMCMRSLPIIMWTSPMSIRSDELDIHDSLSVNKKNKEGI